MELYHADNDIEKQICAKADLMNVPIGGTMELLPLCNMRCKMCYVYKNREDMEKEGQILSADQWLSIAEQGVENGMLFLLLTGGEPLLYPEFRKLYTGLQKLGIITSVNTNGTLIDEEWADFFLHNGSKRISITLYGKDDETYGELCGNPHGFTQVTHALDLLKEREIPFRLTCSITPSNRDQLEEIHAIARHYEAPFVGVSYMFPGTRRDISSADQYRMDPEEAALETLHCFRLMHPDDDLTMASRITLNKMNQIPQYASSKGFTCKAGHSGFWLNWKGEMMCCGMLAEPAIDLKQYSFAEGWKYITEKTRSMAKCRDCMDCRYQNICSVCPAACVAESGSSDRKPEYLCRMTMKQVEEMERLIREADYGK